MRRRARDSGVGLADRDRRRLDRGPDRARAADGRALDHDRRDRLLGAREVVRGRTGSSSSATCRATATASSTRSLIAPAWRLFDAVPDAYAAAKAINAVVMSLAAIPAYFLARRLLRPPLALVVAALTVLVPSMLYTGTLMTENAFYPLFLVVALALVATLERPTPLRQVVLLALLRARVRDARAGGRAARRGRDGAAAARARSSGAGCRARPAAVRDALRDPRRRRACSRCSAPSRAAARRSSCSAPTAPRRRATTPSSGVLHFVLYHVGRARPLPRRAPVRGAARALARAARRDARRARVRRRVARARRLARCSRSPRSPRSPRWTRSRSGTCSTSRRSR